MTPSKTSKHGINSEFANADSPFFLNFEIDPVIDSLFSDLTTEEDDQKLLQDIEKNGIQTPLVVSQDMIIIAGHRRIRAAKQLQLTPEKIPFLVREFSTRDAMIEAAINDNMNRRQMNRFKACVFAIRLLPHYTKQALERKQSGKAIPDDIDSGRALEKVAKKAAVSHVTIHKVQYVLEHGTTDDIQKGLSEIESISALYNLIQVREKIEEMNKQYESSNEFFKQHFGVSIQAVSFDDVIFNPYNPNVMSEANFEMLKKSIAVYGYKKMIITSPLEGKFFIADGEKRVLALKKLGINVFPVLVCHNMTKLGAMMASIILNRHGNRALDKKRIGLLKQLCINRFGKEAASKYLIE